MRILLLGANGQVGRELASVFAAIGDVRACSRSDVDLDDFAAIRQAVSVYQPDFIVNAAAYTAVDKAENDAERALRINYEAVAVLAQEAKKQQAWLLHYSSDYVFDGTKNSPYDEADLPNPLNVYGLSKYRGEQAIKRSGCKYIIFRSSWVMGLYGDNFVKSIINLATHRNTINVVADQVGAPTSAKLIASVSAAAINRAFTNSWPAGLYHLAARGETSWLAIAHYVVGFLRARGSSSISPVISPVGSKNYPAIARRPLNSRLATSKLESVLGFDLPHWQSDLLEFLEDITARRLL